MRFIYLFVLILLSACQTQTSATEMSVAQKQWCKDAGLKLSSTECKTYINTINQRTQQEHLIELKRQGVPTQYDECVQSLPVNIIYSQLSKKYGVPEQNIRDFIPESTFNDFAKCTCSDMIYGGLMPDEAIQKCQTTTVSAFLNQSKDAQLAFCVKNTFNEIRQEYEKQNIAFDETALKNKYSKNIINYCNCVSEAKEDIIHKYQSKTMPQKVQIAEQATINCADKYLNLQ